MSVLRKRFSGLVAVAILSGVMVGCGGGLGSLPNPEPSPVHVDGGVQTQESTLSEPVNNTTETTTILVTPSGGGNPVVAAVPAGISIGAGESVAIVSWPLVFNGSLSGVHDAAPLDPEEAVTSSSFGEQPRVVASRSGTAARASG